MRPIERMIFLPLLMALSAPEAAGYYFGGLEDYAAGVPSQGQKPAFQEQYAGGGILYETLHSGRIGGLDPENRVLVLDSETPGFLGPESVSVPLAVSDEAAIDLCNRESGECRRVGTEGWDSLASIAREDLEGARVIVMGYPGDPARIISIIKE